MDLLGPIDIQILIDNPGLLRSLQQGEASFQATNRNITQQARATGNELDNWAKKASVAAASYFSVSAAKNFIAELVTVRGQFEQLHVAYDTILKSKSKGDALFAETVKFAATTPFNLTEVATATKQLLAYGFAAKDINDVLTTTGNIAAGVSQPIGDIVYLYGTLKTQGRAYAQDIRQFTGRGIPIIAELAKQFGVTEDQVNKLVEAGKVGFPEVEKAFKSLTGSTGIFYNLMEKQSHTLTGQLSNLQDAFAQMLNSIGESNQGLLSGGIQLAASLVSNYQKVLDIVEVLIVTYGAYRAALLLQAAASAANAVAIGLETVAYRLLRDGLSVLNTEKLVAVATTAAYTAVIAALVIALKSWHDAAALQNNINAQTNAISAESVVKIELEKTKINDLVKIINDHNNKQEDRLAALKKLNAISPEYLGNITLETANTKQASQAIKDYLANLDKKLQGEAAYGQKLENIKKITELKTKGVDAISSSERLGMSLKRFFTFNSSAKSLVSGTADDEETVNQLIENYKKANDKIDALFGEQIKKTIAGTDAATGAIASKFRTDLAAAMAGKTVQPIIDAFNKLVKEASGKDDLDALKKGLQDKLDTLVPGDKDQDVLRARIAQVKKLLRSYDSGATATDENSELNAAQRHADLLQKIYQLNEKYNAKTLDDNSQKIKAVRDEYDKLRADIDKYNANPKNTVKINKGTLQANETGAINTQVESNETKGIGEDLEKRKALYAEYENYKEQLGKEAADKQYAELIASGGDFKTYLNFVENLLLSSGLTPQAQEERKALFAKYGVEIQRDEAAKNVELLASAMTYGQQRNNIIQKYLDQAAQLRKDGYKAEADQAILNGEKALTDLDNTKIAELSQYKELYDGLHKLSVKKAQEDNEFLKADLERRRAQNLITEESYLKYKKLFNETSNELKNINPGNLIAIGSVFSNMSNDLTGVNSGLSSLVGAAGSALTAIGNVEKLQAKIKEEQASGASSFQDEVSMYATVAQSIITIIGSITSAAKQRKAAEQAFIDATTLAQNSYNLTLIETLRLKEQLNSNIFYKDYRADILNASLAVVETNKKLEESFVKLQSAQIKTGTRKAVDGNAVGKGATSGAAAGAVIGAAVGVGVLSAPAAVVGAVIGAAAGAIIGLFASKKRVDVFGPLLGVYPDLIQKDKDGINQLNEARAKSLIQSGLLTAQAKIDLQNTLDLNEARKAAVEQINSDIKDLAGGLGDDLRNALVDAFERGQSAADAFGKKVSDVIGNIVSQFLFNDIFGSQFDQLETNLKASFGIDGDQNATDDLTNFYKDAGPLVKQYQDALQAVRDAAKAQGLDVFANPDKSASGSSSTLSGQIKGITSDQANVLEGSIHGMQLAVVGQTAILAPMGKTMQDQLAEMRSQTLIQMEISRNTKRTADNTDEMKDSLKSIDNNTSSTSLTNVLRAAGKL